jgi:16S rRNA (uracil1498-N3)-methyltransferase
MYSLFLIDSLPTSGTYQLTGDEAHHAIKVLRVEMGERVHLSDGKGNWASGTVSAIEKKSLAIEIKDSGFEEPEATQVIAIQAIPKGDRVREAIELLTEAGVDEIAPWQAHRSIGKSEKGSDKWRVAAREATKQSRRFWIPTVHDVTTTKELLTMISGSACILLHESATHKISEVAQSFGANTSKIYLIIGPEGGITDSEIELFVAAGAKIAHLGRPILRSAHAGIAAIAAIKSARGIW